MSKGDHHIGKPPHHEHGAGSVAALRNRIGPVQRFITGMAVSDEAGRGLRRIEAERVAAEVKIAETAIALNTTKICAALVARSMPAIGSLTTTLNTNTSAVDASLTSACAGDVASHILNRHHNRAAIREFEQAGQLTGEEAHVLTEQLESDLATDVERSRRRMADAKVAVEHLHDKALSGIESARAAIETL
jgi:hypothetical protein